MAIQDKMKQVFRRWLERDEAIQTPQSVRATFRLVYDGLTIGLLTIDAGRWTFAYTDEFRSRADLRPITEFPDVHRVYQSEDLWPFFNMRIPSLKQTAIEEILKAENLDRTDEVQLLRRFGKRTVANPFELIGI